MAFFTTFHAAYILLQFGARMMCVAFQIWIFAETETQLRFIFCQAKCSSRVYHGFKKC